MLRPIQPNYAITYQDPSSSDDVVQIMVPDRNWLAAALAGGVLPPVECYLRDTMRDPDEPKEHPYAPAIGPMSEEQAMLYLLMKDVPREVWASPSNRPRFAIAPRASIPTDRSHRNAWRLADFEEAA